MADRRSSTGYKPCPFCGGEGCPACYMRNAQAMIESGLRIEAEAIVGDFHALRGEDNKWSMFPEELRRLIMFTIQKTATRAMYSDDTENPEHVRIDFTLRSDMEHVEDYWSIGGDGRTRFQSLDVR